MADSPGPGYTRIEACGGLEGLPYNFGSDAAPTTPVARQQNQHIEAPAGLPFFPSGSGAGPTDSTSGPFGGGFDPATSTAQRQLFAIAEHNPSALHKENKGLANLPKSTLHEFAATKGLKK